MNVYQKLMAARHSLRRCNLKKTGLNKFAGYSYFELGDFLPDVQEIFSEVGLCGIVSYTAELATLKIIDMALDTHTHDGVITITSPMGSAALKGCHEVQNIGAVETYQRRYLWVTAMEIVEHDVLDAVTGGDKMASMKTIVANDLADISEDVRRRLETVAGILNHQLADGLYDLAVSTIKEATDGDPTLVNALRAMGDKDQWKRLGVYRLKLKADATKQAQAVAVAKYNSTKEGDSNAI